VLPWKTVVFQKASLHGLSRVSCAGEERCFPLGNPAAMSPKEDLGQWLCAPPFRAVCLFPTLYISAGMNENFNKKDRFFKNQETMGSEGKHPSTIYFYLEIPAIDRKLGQS